MSKSIPSDLEPDQSLDFSTIPVPSERRMPKVALTMAWWGACSAMFWVVVAALFAMNYGTKNVLIGMALSVACFGVINGILARYAIETGLSVALFSRSLFGSAGASLAALIFSATAIYYAIFEGSVIAVAIHATFSKITFPIAAAIVVAYSVPLIFGSMQNWLDKLNGVLLPIYLVGLFGTLGVALYQYGYSNAWLNFGASSAGHPYAWIDCFVGYMGVWIMMMYTFDFARFGKVEDVKYHSRYNFGVPFYLVTFVLNGLFGLFIAATVPTEGGVTEVSVVLGILKLMGIAGLVFVWATQTRINTANFHLAAVNMETLVALATGRNPGKIIWAIVVGAIVYVLMLADVFSYILKALSYQGIFVVAWVAIALTHIAAFRGAISEQAKTFNYRGISAWFGGSACGVLAMQAGADWARFSAPITAVAAALIYFAAIYGRSAPSVVSAPKTI